MTDAEKELRCLIKKLVPTASARCVYARPPHKHEVCGFRLFYKGTLVREFFSRREDKSDLAATFLATCKEKLLIEL